MMLADVQDSQVRVLLLLPPLLLLLLPPLLLLLLLLLLEGDFGLGAPGRRIRFRSRK